MIDLVLGETRKNLFLYCALGSGQRLLALLCECKILALYYDSGETVFSLSWLMLDVMKTDGSNTRGTLFLFLSDTYR